MKAKIKQTNVMLKMSPLLSTAQFVSRQQTNMALRFAGRRKMANEIFRLVKPTTIPARLLNSAFSGKVQQSLRSDAQTIFRSALEAVTPQTMVKGNVSFDKNVLEVMGKEYQVANNVSVVAFGKAVLGMAKAVEDILGHNIIRGVASVPYGLRNSIKVCICVHVPVPVPVA